MQIYVLGLSHHSAPLEVRERVAFLPEETQAALTRLRDGKTIHEIALLSTCNRTEFYTVADDGEAAVEAQKRLVREVKDIDLGERSVTYVHRQRDCVEHLFRVAAGVDSMVIGEPEILGQVKDAFQLASDSHGVGTVFGKLFPSAFRVGKRARSETGIGRGAVSLAKAGVQLAEKIFGDLERRSALVIGAGEIATGVAILLHDQPLGSLTFANRTLARAEEFAKRFGGSAVPLSDLPQALRHPDIVVSAVTSSEPVVRRADVAPAFVSRRGARLVLDLGVPRNVEPEVARLQQVFLYAVDDLQELVNLNLGRRKREVAAVEEIVGEEADRFFGWMTALSTKPVVKELREEADRVRVAAIEKLGRLTPEQEAVVKKFSLAYMNKMLHSPSVSLRECDPGTYRGLARIAWTRRLFGLGDVEVNGSGPESDD